MSAVHEQNITSMMLMVIWIFFQMLVVWAVQYIATAYAATAIGAALTFALTAYQYYGYAQMAVGALRAIEGGGTAMANFAILMFMTFEIFSSEYHYNNYSLDSDKWSLPKSFYFNMKDSYMLDPTNEYVAFTLYKLDIRYFFLLPVIFIFRFQVMI